MTRNTEIKFTAPKNEALKCFYDVAAQAPPGFQFFSPTSLGKWRKEVTQWLCDGQNACEVGPGKGYLVLHTAKVCSAPLDYLLLDISKAMLDATKEKLNKIGNPFLHCHYVQCDIEGTLPPEVSRKSISRLVAVNVLQDVEAGTALTNMKQVLMDGGILRTTMIAKEIQDDFWQNDPDYDPEKGIWYSSSCYHEENCSKPMGYRLINGQEKPFYRQMQCYTKEEVIELFRSQDLEVQHIKQLVYPIEYVMKRWSSKYHFMRLNDRQKGLLEKWQGYPDGWSVTAVAS